MEISSIFLLLAVLILAALFVARPFLQSHNGSAVSSEEHELSSLLAERERLIAALQELDFDQDLGKIPAEDYPAARAKLVQQAADVLRKLDVFQAAPPDVESRIEAAIAARLPQDRGLSQSRQEQADAVAPTNSDDVLEELIAARKLARKEKSAGFCPQCGKPVLRSDRFCPHCGKPVRQNTGQLKAS